MISTTKAGKRYGDKIVLDQVDVEIPKNAVTTLIGSNGAGKSTLLSLISRLMQGEGQVLIDQRPLHSFKDKELAQKLSSLRQTNNISVRLTVRELVGFGRYPYSESRLNDADKQKVQQAITYMELDELADSFIDQLSGGERQRAFIAMVIAQDTEYILLDEPLNNLDMKHSVQIMRLLRTLADEHGKTVVMVLHDINFASFYSDYIIALRHGKLLRQGSTEQMIQPDVLREIYNMDFTVQEVDGNRLCVYYK